MKTSLFLISTQFLFKIKMIILNLVYGLMQVDVPLEVVHLTDEYWNNVVNILSFLFLVQFP